MLKDLGKNENLVKILLILLIIAVGSYVLNLFWQIIGKFFDIIFIFIFAWLLSFILEPTIDKIKDSLKLQKIWATLITYVLVSTVLVAFVLLFVPVVTIQIQALVQIIPSYLESAPKLVNNWGDLVTSQLTKSINLLPSVAQFLFSVFLMLIFSFYFNVDEEKITKEMFRIVPEKWHPRMIFMKKVISDVFASFLRLQLVNGLFTWISTWIVLALFGVSFAASSSFLAGIIGLIPLLGAPLSLIPPVFVALLINPSVALTVGVILLVSQQILFNILGPKFLSGAFKLHPAIILFAFIVGLKIAGSIGAIFAIPVLGILVVFIRELNQYLNENSKRILE